MHPTISKTRDGQRAEFVKSLGTIELGEHKGRDRRLTVSLSKYDKRSLVLFASVAAFGDGMASHSIGFNGDLHADYARRFRIDKPNPRSPVTPKLLRDQWTQHVAPLLEQLESEARDHYKRRAAEGIDK